MENMKFHQQINYESVSLCDKHLVPQTIRVDRTSSNSNKHT